MLFPSNAWFKVHISYKTQPSAHTSLFVSYARPSTCSYNRAVSVHSRLTLVTAYRWHVKRSADPCLCKLTVWSQYSGKAKVAKLDISVGIEKNVARLQVAMQHYSAVFFAVTMFQSYIIIENELFVVTNTCGYAVELNCGISKSRWPLHVFKTYQRRFARQCSKSRLLVMHFYLFYTFLWVYVNCVSCKRERETNSKSLRS